MRQPKNYGLGSIAMVVMVRVVWIIYICDVGGAGQRTRGIDEGWRGKELQKGGVGLPYSVPAQQKQLANI